MDAQLSSAVLQPGDKLNWYTIDRVLGRGGFGITYLATDTNLQKQVAIKEYLPDQVAQRDPDNSLRPSRPELDQTYQWGLDRFIREAQTLGKFKHPNIVRVYAVFEANATAYMVMEYERGSDLKSCINNDSLNSEENLKTLFHSILDGLALVHKSGFIHRDIKPANIIIRENGSPVLIDFGSARKSFGSKTSTLTSLVSVGYAPLEQYGDTDSERQGPWTDIYACGAVLYYAICGKAPIDATQRGSAIVNGSADPFRPLSELAAGRYSQPFLAAIDWALNFAINDRPQDLQQWLPKLFEPGSAAPAASAVADRDDDSTVLMPASRKPGAAGATRTATAADPEDWDISGMHAFADTPATTAGSDRSGPIEQAATRGSRKSALVLSGVAGLLLLAAAAYLLRQASTPSVTADADIVASDTRATEPLPLDQANQALSSAAGAIADTDMTALKKLGSLSEKNEKILGVLFAHFASISVEISPFEHAADSEAEIRLLQMTRASGTVALPASSYRKLRVRIAEDHSGGVLLSM